MKDLFARVFHGIDLIRLWCDICKGNVKVRDGLDRDPVRLALWA